MTRPPRRRTIEGRFDDESRPQTDPAELRRPRARFFCGQPVARAHAPRGPAGRKTPALRRDRGVEVGEVDPLHGRRVKCLGLDGLYVCRAMGGRGDIRPGDSRGRGVIRGVRCGIRRPRTNRLVSKGFHEHVREAMTNSVCNSGRDSTGPLGPATDGNGDLSALRCATRPSVRADLSIGLCAIQVRMVQADSANSEPSRGVPPGRTRSTILLPDGRRLRRPRLRHRESPPPRNRIGYPRNSGNFRSRCLLSGYGQRCDGFPPGLQELRRG